MKNHTSFHICKYRCILVHNTDPVEISTLCAKIVSTESTEHYIENHPWDKSCSKGLKQVFGTLKNHFQTPWERIGRYRYEPKSPIMTHFQNSFFLRCALCPHLKSKYQNFSFFELRYSTCCLKKIYSVLAPN